MHYGMQYRELRNKNIQLDPHHNTTLNENKRASLSMAGYFKVAGLSYKNILNCSNTIVYGVDKAGKAEVRHVYRCKNNLCPNCQKVAFKENSIHSKKILDKMTQQQPGGFFKHLTLSEGNVNTGEELHNNLTRLDKALTILTGYKPIKKYMIGFISALEIVPSWNRGNMQYNGHIHVTAYFNEDVNIDWSKYWSRAMKRCGTTKETYAYSKKITATKGHTALDNAKKVVDYDNKPFNLMNEKISGIKSDKNLIKAIKDYSQGLFRMQKVKWGGRCKKIHHTMNQVKKAKKFLRKKQERNNDIVQVISKYNNKKHAYYFTGIQFENCYLAKRASLAVIHQYRDADPYLE